MADPLPGDYPMTLYRGDTRVITLDFTEDDGTASDLSGHTWRAQIRQSFEDATVDAEFTVDATASATGRLVLTLPSTQAELLDSAIKYRWDLEGTAGSVVHTYLAGKVKVTGDISRAA